jgi:DNA-binding ferritin-like protein
MYPRSTYQEFLEISPIAEQGMIPSKEMVSTLLHDTSIMIALLREWIQNEEDLVTQDMFIGCINDLEKKSWMMKSLRRSGAIG